MPCVAAACVFLAHESQSSWVRSREHFQKDILVSPEVAAPLEEFLFFFSRTALLDGYIVCERIFKLDKKSIIWGLQLCVFPILFATYFLIIVYFCGFVSPLVHDGIWD